MQVVLEKSGRNAIRRHGMADEIRATSESVALRNSSGAISSDGPDGFLKGFGSWLWAFVRWLYVLLLFLYLFALVTALFQAHSFQQLVAHLIATEDDIGGTADEYRRRVLLLAVANADARSRAQNSTQALLDEVAGRAGTLRTAVDALTALDGKYRLVAAEGGEPPQDRFKRIRERIDAASKRLEAAVIAAWPATEGPDIQDSAEPEPGDGAEPGGDTSPGGAERSSLAEAYRYQAMQALMELRASISELLPQLTPRDNVNAAALEQAKTRVTRALDELIERTAATTQAAIAVDDLSLLATLAEQLPGASEEDKASKAKLVAQVDAVIAAGVSLSAVTPARSGDAGEKAAIKAREARQAFIGKLIALREALPPPASRLESKANAAALRDAVDRLLRRALAAGSPAARESELMQTQLAAHQSFRAALGRLMEVAQLSPAQGEPACLDIRIDAFRQAWEGENARVLTLDGQDPLVPDIRAILLAWGSETGDEGLATVVTSPQQRADQTLDPGLAAAIKRFRESDWARQRGGEPAPDKLSVADDSLRALLIAWIDEASGKGRVTLASDGTCVAVPHPLVTRIDDQIDALASFIRDPRRQLIHRVYTPIAEIRAVVDQLGLLRVSNPSAAADTTDEDPQRLVERQIKELGKFLAELENVLTQERQPVQTVARAIGENVPDPGRQAQAILDAYRDLGVTQGILTPLGWLCEEQRQCGWSKLGFDAKRLATSGTQIVDLMVVFVMGAAGSLLYITQYLLCHVIQGRPLSYGAGKSFAWFVFRPIFGVVIAFALYLLYKAGQIALGAGTATSLSSEVNLPILSTVALFAGLLSWQVLEFVEDRGRRLFANARREPLWAVGLENVLNTREITKSELAGHLGVSEKQVQRWIELTDRVTPEMQDRIGAWLDVQPIALFSARRDLGPKMHRRAYGLKALMAAKKIDKARIADALDVSLKTVQQWMDVQEKVPPDKQTRLIRELDENYDTVFGEPPADGQPSGEAGAGTEEASGAPAEPVPTAPGSPPVWAPNDMPAADKATAADSARPALWAVGLRRALYEAEDPDSAHLASLLFLDQDDIRAWMELDRPVPHEQQALIEDQLLTDTVLFAGAKPSTMLQIADPEVFEQALARHPAFDDEAQAERLTHFAKVIDVDLERLKRWLDPVQPAPIAPATAERLRNELGEFADGELLIER